MRIGERLINSGLITQTALDSALQEQKISNIKLGEIILQRGHIPAEKMGLALAEHFHLSFIELKKKYKEISAEVIDMIPVDMARQFKIIPVEKHEHTLIIATADPLNLKALDIVRIKTGYKIKYVLALESNISEAIEYCYHNLSHIVSCVDNFITTNKEVKNLTNDSDEKHYEASDQPVIQYVKSLIVYAVNNRASDIILQPKQAGADLRLRIDGILYKIDSPPKVMLPAITTRIKILSELAIAERRLPQDGRFKINIGQKEIDIRTSAFPTIYGESVVLRILDTAQPMLGMEQLGLSVHDLATLKDLVRHSYGLILVTGPTGSGKTTTLYTALNEIKSSELNIISLEDLVE